MKHQDVSKFVSAILSLSLLGSVGAFAATDRGHGSDGVGQGGLKALADGDISLADQRYAAEYAERPGDPLAIYNLATSFKARGRLGEADRLFSQAALLGQNYIPDFLMGVHDANATVRDMACMHLAQDLKSDPNCPGSGAALPPPMMEAAPPR